MGLLNKLFGPKGPEFTERIWLSTEGKLRDLVTQVRTGQERGATSVVVTHFNATQASLLDMLDQGGVRRQVITNSNQFATDVPGLLRQGGSTLVLASDAIPFSVTRTVGAPTKQTTLAPVSVHLAEHYPCPDRDQRVLALDKVWPMQLAFTCYTSLDEPWLIAFGADRIRELLPKLGAGPESLLEHPLLNRSIQAAQQRVAKQVLHEHTCQSCAEWVRRNLPDRA